MIITRLLGLGRKQSQNLFWGGEEPSHACGHGELTQLPGISGIRALCTLPTARGRGGSGGDQR